MNKIYDLGSDLSEQLRKAKHDYNYEPVLTSKLDKIQEDFTEITMLEMVLWKINRYPEFDQTVIDEINLLRKTHSIDHGKSLLKRLLMLKGFDLPMASTVLRFAAPHQFQIIDQRVYRFIYENEDVFKIPYNIDKKVRLYFEYLEKLKLVCLHFDIEFVCADRILYQLDKNINSDYPIKY